MLKRCGKIRTWHFAHDWRYANDDQKKCSYESYLHSYAKLRLKQWFESSKELIIRYDVQNVCHLKSSCSFSHYKDACTRIDSKTFDLKKCLDRCSVEESVQSGDCRFRADLLWYSSTKPTNAILIEVKVSHGCTEKKKSANVRTIEFEISSEEDIESIVSCNEISESETVHFYGFNTNNSVYDISPEIELRKFILYKSGKTFSV